MNSSQQDANIVSQISDTLSLSHIRLIIGRVLSSDKVTLKTKKSFVHAKSMLASNKEHDNCAILSAIQKHTDELAVLEIFENSLKEFSSNHSLLAFTDKDTGRHQANTDSPIVYNDNGKHINYTEHILGRPLKQEERESLSDLYRLLEGDLEKYLDAIINSEEVRAKNKTTSTPDLPHLSDAEFILFAFLATIGRYPSPQELYAWSYELLNISYTREEAFNVISKSFNPLRVDNSMVLEVFGRNKIIGPQQHSTSSHASIMGTTDICGPDDWDKKKTQLNAFSSKKDNKEIPSNYFIATANTAAEKPVLSIITSLYNGDQFIDGFLNNMVNQENFSDYELIIIDACSPGGERNLIDAYKSEYPNIVYHRCDERISIYEAWNMGVEMARGDYLTNANLDDLRRPDGLAMQVAALERFNHIDIVYGDFFYFFEANPDWDLIENVGIRSSLSLVSKGMLLTQNYPHCAPLWRKSLHRDLGLFDTSYKSAADWEFWLRCIHANKKFYYIPIPLSAYYHNPNGISTAADSRGIEEVANIYRKHYSNLIMSTSSDLLIDDKSFNHKHPSNAEKSLCRRSRVLRSFVDRLDTKRKHQPDKFFARLY